MTVTAVLTLCCAAAVGSPLEIYYMAKSTDNDARHRAPLSVLEQDDECLNGARDDEPKCGAHLLQRNVRAHAHRTRRSVSDSTMPSNFENHVHEYHFDEEKEEEEEEHKIKANQSHGHFVASVVLASIHQVAARAKRQSGNVSKAWDIAQHYIDQFDHHILPNIVIGQEKSQRLISEHVEGFNKCNKNMHARMEMAQQLQKVYSGWQVMHQDCFKHSSAIGREVSACQRQVQTLEDRQEQDCATDGNHSRSNASAFLGEQCALIAHDLLETKKMCNKKEDIHATKQQECNSVQLSLETAGCLHSSQVTGICEAYSQCRASMKIAFGVATDTSMALERNTRAELPAVAAIKCIALGMKEIVNKRRNSLLKQVETCELKTANATAPHMEHLGVQDPLPCVQPVASPCKSSNDITVPAPVNDAGSSKMEFVSDNASLANQTVSTPFIFFQGEIHKMIAESPKSASNILLAPSVLAFATSWMLLSAFCLSAWCVFVIVRPMVSKWRAPASGPTHLLDAMHAHGAELTSDISSSEMTNFLDSGHWLCPELVVPKDSKCTIAVPPLGPPSNGYAMSSVGITDKLGQPLFNASLLPTPAAAESDASNAMPSMLEHILVTRQDGTALATCELHLPSDCAHIREQCRILQSDGQLFAWLKCTSCRESRQASWIFRKRDRNPAAELIQQRFVFTSSDPSAWKIQVQGDLVEGKLSITDGANRSLANVTRSSSFAFNTDGRELYRIDVGGERDTDLGLITAVLLIVDRILRSRGK